MALVVIYGAAHTGTDQDTGAHTLHGTSERSVAHRALEGLMPVIDRAGGTVDVYAGPVEDQVLKTNQRIAEAVSASQQHVALSLHFNATPIVNCAHCRARTKAGINCAECGNETLPRWRFGPCCMAPSASLLSLDLCTMIGVELSAAMPWHPQPLQHIRMPDPRYGEKKWPELVAAPVVLVEAGFDVDPLFSAWVRDEENQREYGRAVARATVAWAAKYADSHKKKEVS